MRCEDLVVKLVVRQVQAAEYAACGLCAGQRLPVRGRSPRCLRGARVQYFGQCLKLGKGPTRSAKVEREQHV